MYNKESAFYEPHQDAPTITVKGRNVFIDGVQLPPKVVHHGRQQIYWRHQDSTGFSYGYLNFHQHGQTFHGMFAKGPSPSKSSLVAIQGAVPPSTYTTKISKTQTYDPKTKQCSAKQDDFVSGLEVTIGYTWDEGTKLPQQIFKVGGKDLKDEMRMDSATHFIIDEDPATEMYADDNPKFPMSGEFTMAADSQSFSGSITLKGAGQTKTNFCWIGTSTSSDVAADDDSSMLTSESFVQPAAFVAMDDEPLSVLDLFTLCHAPKEIRQDAQNMMMSVMEYVVAAPDQHPDWIENFLGKTRPILAPGIQKVADLPKSQQFYTNFAIPYIGLGIYQNKGQKGIPDIPLLEARTMLYYFQNGLAKEPGYNEQTNGLYLQAFLADKPRLQAYLDDQEAKKAAGEGDYYWADQLHTAVLSPDNIDMLVSSVIHQQGDVHQQLRDYGTVLNLLQPSGELAQDAYTKLLTAVFGVVTETMNPKDLKSKIYPWVHDFIQSFVDKFDKGEPPEIDKEKHDAWEIAQAFKEAAHLVGDFAVLANEITGLIVAERVSNIYERSVGVGKKIVQKLSGKISETKLNHLKRGVITTVHVSALYTTIQAFMEWKEIPTEQKVALVADTVRLGLEILIDLPEIVSDAVGVFKVIRKFLYKSSTLQSLGESFGRMASRAGQWVEDIAQAIREFLPEGATNFVIRAGNFLEGIFESLPRVLGYIAPLVSLIVVITNIITLINEPDAPIQDKILLVIQTIAGLMETAFLALGLIVEELLSFAGPFAILAVIAAIVQFFVDMFDKPKPPPSPAEKFYSDYVKGYIKKLTPPPMDFDPEGTVPPPKK